MTFTLTSVSGRAGFRFVFPGCAAARPSCSIAAGPRSLFPRGYRISQRPNSADAHLDRVAGRERPDPRGSSRGDHVAGKQRHHLRYPMNYSIGGKEHLAGVSELLALSVNMRFDGGGSDDPFGFDERADGAESVEALAARELNVAYLEVASRDVVQASVAENVAAQIFSGGRPIARFADNDGEFAFVIHALRDGWNQNGFIRPDHRARRLQENQRLLRNFVAKLGGMLGIIPSDAHNFGGHGRNQKTNFRERPIATGELGHAEETLDFADLAAFDDAGASFRMGFFFATTEICGGELERLKSAKLHCGRVGTSTARGAATGTATG